MYTGVMAKVAMGQQGPSGSFQAATVAAIEPVRDAFARIIERKCRGPKVVTGVCEAFGVHRKLAWQVIKVAYSADPFVAARHVPGGKPLEVWLEAARGAGVPRALVDTARRAADQFAEHAASAAGSRAELEMLLESCAAAENESHEKWRQQSYEGNAFTWGAHCRVLMAMMVLSPSVDRARHFHVAQVKGLVGFRQTRAGVRWVVNQTVVADDAARIADGLSRRALDPEAAAHHGGVPVIPRFCSEPVPELSRRSVGGMVVDEIVAGPLGQAGERTLVTGEVIRNLGRAHATPEDRIAHFGAGVRIPAESLHLDVFTHRGLFGEVERELRVFSDLASPVAFDDADALPVPERLSKLGLGVSLAQSPDIPGYPELASWVFSALGEDPAEYELVRVRMAYPPMPATVMVRHPLPPE